MAGPFHGSHWFHGLEPPRCARLWGDRRVDVAVIGGGITGVTAALLCKQAGMTVAVLEARTLGAGVTGGTSAHLTAMADARFVRLEENFGARRARQVWDTGVAAVDRIEALVRDLDIDCDFHRVEGALYAAKPTHVSQIEAEAKAGRRIGVPFDVVDELPLPYAVHRALRFTEGQARFHPIKYLYGLAKAVQGLNSEIFTDSRVLRVEPGDVCTLTTEQGQVHAKHVIVATHSPIGVVLSVHTRIAPYRSYCIEVELPDHAPDGLYWDTEEPYNYVRKVGANRLIVGGRDHKTGHGSDLVARYDELEAWTAERFPGAKRRHGWSAQVFEPADGLPYIGPVPGAKNVTMATGFAGNGLTFGTAAAMLLTDLVAGRANAWASLYDPARTKPVASASHVVKENVDVAFRFLADRLSAADAQTLEDVPIGEGRLVRMDGRKLAVYRDKSGDLHVMSPVCTHLGCVVQWNDAEKSWDCPCHGGRYEATGEVLDGPPVRGLDSTNRTALVWGPDTTEEPAVLLQPDTPRAK